MELFLQILVVITSVIMIALVLLHRAKGGGLSTLFGGGMASNLSGSTVAEKNLNRFTVITAVIWFIAIVGIGLVVKYA